MLDYKLISNWETSTLGIRIFVGGPELTEEEIKIISKYNDVMYNAIADLRYLNNPENIAIHKQIVDRLKACFPVLIYAKEIPNEYNNDKHSPWLLVTTPRGIIKVGWRKRVIVIDWSQSDIPTSGIELFASEETTKTDKSIHAWSYESAETYLGHIYYS